MRAIIGWLSQVVVVTLLNLRTIRQRVTSSMVSMVDVLKRELRARGLTYARVARHLGLSEASVKRMFSQRNFTLRRLDQICTLAGTEFSDHMRTLVEEDSLISQLTLEQEREIIANKKLFVVAVCALNHVTFEQIVRLYDIAPAECVQLLLRLGRLEFIRLLPNNRIKLLVSRTFSWIPDGPIARYFTEQAHNEYFRSRFDRSDEFMLVEGDFPITEDLGRRGLAMPFSGVMTEEQVDYVCQAVRKLI